MTEGTTRTLWCVTLLDQLRQEGFDVGITQYLQVETLFDRVEAPLNPSDLKTLICPIVARSVEEQQRFGELFDAYLAAQKVNDYDGATVIAPLKLRPSHPSSPLSAPPAPRWTDRRSVRVALGAAFAIVFAVVSWFVARAITPCVGAECGQGAKKDSVVAPGKPDTTKGTAIAKPTLVVPAQSRVVSIHPSDTTRTAPTPSVWPERGLAFAVPLFLFALFAWWRNYRKQAVAERTSASNAPFVWPIRIANAGNSLFAVADLASTARALRRRQPGNEVRLAIEPSVQATIHAFGFPTFRFSAVTRPSEYVMLIESSSARDNQARYFGALASRLEAEGAFITQYYFDRDPRVCYRESDGRSFKIVDLARQHSNDRLIVFSNGSPFLHPVRGTVQSWIDLFDTWSDRAILTPVPPRRWGAREVALRGCFLVLPATLEGLRAVADHFDAGTRPELSRWKERDRSTGKAITATAIEADELRAELGDDLFRWVAACSIYPELYWDLSAHLGELPAIASVFSESNALRLIQLSWFRDGAMPEKLRHALQLELKNLDASLTDTEALVRTSLIELLERDPISFETAAGEEQQRQLLLQRLYLYREDKLATDVVKRELESKFPTDELLQDVTVVRLLDRASNPLALKLSRAIRNGLWRGGHPAFATRTLAYGVVPVIVGVVLAAQIKAPGTKADTSTNAPQSVAVVPLYRSVQLPPSTAFELGAIGVDSTGTPITNATTAWSVNDTSLATVVPHDSGNSTLTTRATQSASTVQLSILNTRASMDVRVQSGVPAIVWTSAVIDSGVPTQIGATGRRTGWVSCRSDVADVASATGVVIGHLPGSTMLTRSLNSSDVKKVGGTAKASMFDFGFDKEVVRPGTEFQIVHVRVPIADVKTASARDLNFVTMPISPYHVQSSVSDDSTVNLHLQSFKTLRQSDSTLQLNVVISYPSTSDADAGTSFMGRVTNLARQLSISGAVTPSHEIFTSANCDNSAVSRVAATVELSRVDFIVAHGTQAAAATTDMSTSGSRPSGNGKAPSTSSTAVPMPNIIGQTRNAAVARLRELGIQRIVFNDTSNSAANNIVAMAKPVPGTLVRPGGLVSLTTTTNKQLAFPNWIGQPSSVAQQVASYSGFVMVVDTILVDSLSRNYSDLIGSQRPAAGSRARVGDTIRVTVDVLRIKVPPLTGLDLQTALKQLSAVGLTARVDTTRVSASRMPLGSVLKQSPVSGTRVRKQSEVQLTIILAAETNGANSNSPGNTVYSDSVFAKHALDVVVQKYPASDLQNAIQALQKNTPRTTWLADLVESASKSYGVTPTQMRDLVQLTLCRTPTSDEAAAFAGELAKVGPKAFVQSRLNSPEGLRVRASCIDGRGASAK